jgi:hypothetical protein
MFDAARYLRDRRIDFDLDERGWAHIQCPMCRSAVTGSQPNKKYMAYNQEKGYFTCWRCGGHDPENVVMALEGCQYHEACSRVLDYQAGYESRSMPWPVKQERLHPTPTHLEWPACTVAMMAWHKEYLASRGYDPEYLECKYRLLGTLDCGPYANRVLAPIFHEGHPVSYQGRDITGQSDMKYKTCRKADEVVHHKHILYNLDNRRPHVLIVVEGIMDVWRLGDGAAATFGTKVTPEQVGLIASLRPSRLFTIFDVESDAQRRARWLRDQVAPLGMEAVNVRLSKGDPGDLPQDEADILMRELLK